ncbi:MAG: dicarboxylate/amino acid:cation symporter [Kiritimatiellae bacterium]|nr:dicarboxylate/amino acid:cation symporter [Kiritimatiellia bacterium]
MRSPASTRRILMGMAWGAATGLLLHAVRARWPAIAPAMDRHVIGGMFDAVGRLFLSAIQLLVVPLALVSLSVGMAGAGSVRRLGRIGARVMGLYVGTTAVAVSLALLLAHVVGPGRGASRPAAVTAGQPGSAPSAWEMLGGLVPPNPVRAMAEGNMLQVIVLALLVGAALVQMGTRSGRLRERLEDWNDLLLAMVGLVMRAAPVGVFALIARVLAAQGPAVAGRLLAYMGTLLAALALHVAIVYGTLIRGLAKLPFGLFLRRFREALLVAFSTSSSNATLPVTLDVLQNRVGVSRSIAAFAVPLGATINMDGTAIMQGVATVFIAQVYGVPLGWNAAVQIVAVATLASIGTAGVPGVGLVMLAMVLRQVGLPLEGIGLVLGVDRLLDMARTAVNVLGDGVVATVVARLENELDESVLRGGARTEPPPTMDR